MRDIFETLHKQGKFDYGTTIALDTICAWFHIDYPEEGTRQEFKRAELALLKVTDYIRSQLLNEGKYFKQDGEAFRVLLPSENIHQAELYIKSANRKYNRALKLVRNTPSEQKQNTNVEARIEMRKTKTRRFNYGTTVRATI